MDHSEVTAIISILLVPAFILFVVFFIKLLKWIANRPKKKLLEEIASSADVNDLVKYYLNQDTDIRSAAEKRADQLAAQAKTPAEFLKIAENPRIRLKGSVYKEALERFDDEDFSYHLVNGEFVPDDVRLQALDRIRDKDHLCQIAYEFKLSEEICKKALLRIDDQDAILGIALKTNWKAAIGMLDEEHSRQMGEILCAQGKHDYAEIEERYESGEYDNDRHYRITTYRCRRCGKIKTEEHPC